MTTIYVLSLATKLFPEIAKGIYVELYYTFQPPYGTYNPENKALHQEFLFVQGNLAVTIN